VPIVAAIQRYVEVNPTRASTSSTRRCVPKTSANAPLSRLSSAAAEYQAPRQAPIAGSGENAARDPGCPNEVWSADFLADALWSGRRFRTFNVMDDFNREVLRIEIDTNLLVRRIVRALDELVARYVGGTSHGYLKERRLESTM
jgi:transposase InsO family protein